MRNGAINKLRPAVECEEAREYKDQASAEAGAATATAAAKQRGRKARGQRGGGWSTRARIAAVSYELNTYREVWLLAEDTRGRMLAGIPSRPSNSDGSRRRDYFLNEMNA